MLAFPGLVYKMGNQEGSYYPDAHTQRTATRRHTGPKCLIHYSSSAVASGLLIADMDKTAGSTDIRADGLLAENIITEVHQLGSFGDFKTKLLRPIQIHLNSIGQCVVGKWHAACL